MATLSELEARKQELLRLIRLSERFLVRDRNTLQQLEQQIKTTSFDQGLAVLLSKKESTQRNIKQEEQNLQRYQTELAQVENQIANFQPQPTARQSTGTTVKEDQAANADGADVQNPNRGPQVVTAAGRVTPAVTDAPTNAERFGTAPADAGTNDPVRKQAQLMATPGIVAQPGPAAPNGRTGYPSQTAGAASGSDDTPAANNVRATIENIFGSGTAGPIVPRENVLDQFASYSYNISIYIMSQPQFVKMLATKSKDISGFQLLMRSGGAPAAGGTMRLIDPQEAQQAADGNSTGPAQAELGRSQFFPLDYYIDDVRIESLTQGKATGGAHNLTSMNFTITEPNGISLFDNLYQAAQQYNSLESGISSTRTDYASQAYLMVIRFYGYDANGNLAKPSREDSTVPGTDPNAVVEKFIPFQFTNITFRIANSLTEYRCECVCPQFNIGYSQGRGTIPYNVEISSQTLRELFTGNLAFATPAQSGTANTDGRQGQQADIRRVDNAILSGETGTTVTAGSASNVPAPPKANSAATPAFTTGLATALNKFQEELVEKKFFLFPDTYEIVFPQGAEIIADAKVTPPGGLNKQATAFNTKAGATAADLKDPAKSTPNTNSKTTNATAGMSIVQFLDQYIRTSTYIYDQQTKIVNPNDPNAPPIPQGSPTGVTAWYNISVEARPKQYDPKRNDYAYHIIYRITPYKVNDLRSDWFPLSEFQGIHKVYNYWFTGQNSSVIDLEMNFNYLYYLVISGGQAVFNATETGNYREYIKKIFQPASNQSSQGITNSQVNEPSANAADSLYSPADLNEIRMRIVGDPAWIQQGELWQGVSGLQMNYDAFLPDGTINYAAQEALFEVLFNKPVDYDLGTGLMDPGQKNYGANRPDGRPGSASQSYVFRARQIINYFSRGKFEQELDGNLVRYEFATDQDKAQNQRVAANAENAQAGDTANRPGTQPVSVLRQDQSRVVGTPSAWNYAEVNRALKDAPDNRASLVPQTIPSDDAATARTLPAAPARPPTSGTQAVGPAATTVQNSTPVSGTTAFGSALGAPLVQVITSAGQTVTATSQNQLNQLYNSGQIPVGVYNTASAALAVRQQQSNSPVTDFSIQQLKKDNG